MRLFVFADQSVALGCSLNVWRVFREAVKGAACCNEQTNRQIKIHDMLTHLKSWRGVTARCDSHVSVIVRYSRHHKKAVIDAASFIYTCVQNPRDWKARSWGGLGLFCKALSSRAHICHKYHKLYLWRKNCHVEKFWEILEKFWEILGDFFWPFPFVST